MMDKSDLQERVARLEKQATFAKWLLCVLTIYLFFSIVMFFASGKKSVEAERTIPFHLS